ncbi:hypothetical protein GV828_00135 [Flavobacterium sp. NST-5]|uniref:Uncharacterized protein n=1 Tax=Flavobacterium ichthyis TaxID=2698827 RepID=A0ABW9Z663_9FLAO|nr:hypothetical protein [Flavobacterium ichthyis]NBL63605.1 hypothetical protein [Flavobacterium ichthyis]
MKAAYKLNYFFITLPAALALFGLIEEKFLYYSLLSFIPLGLYQIVITIRLASVLSTNVHYQIYVIGVHLFFILAVTLDFWWDYLEPNSEIFYGIPPLLAIYFSFILYQKSRKL